MLQKLMFWKNKNTAHLSQEEKEELEEQKLKEEMFDVVIFTFLIFGFLLILYTYTWRSYTLEELAWFGDSFGVLTSFFTGLAFYGLMVTIRLQRKALKTQKEEMKENRRVLQEQSNTIHLQQFENTFFKLLDNLLDSINTIEINGKKGREATNLLIDELTEELDKIDQHNEKQHTEHVTNFFRRNINLTLKIINPLSACLLNIDRFCPESRKEFYISLLFNYLSPCTNGLIFYYCIKSQLFVNHVREDSCEQLYKKLNIDISKMYISISNRDFEAQTKPKFDYA